MALPIGAVKSERRLFQELNENILTLLSLAEALNTGITTLLGRIDDVQAEINERSQYGVVTGLTTAEQDVPDMTVKVAAGTLYMANGDKFTPEEDLYLVVIEADATNPRIDIIYVNAIGIISYLPGTAAEVPTAAELPLGGQLLAEITVAANATAIENANITDKRKIITN